MPIMLRATEEARTGNEPPGIQHVDEEQTDEFSTGTFGDDRFDETRDGYGVDNGPVRFKDISLPCPSGCDVPAHDLPRLPVRLNVACRQLDGTIGGRSLVLWRVDRWLLRADMSHTLHTVWLQTATRLALCFLGRRAHIKTYSTLMR